MCRRHRRETPRPGAAVFLSLSLPPRDGWMADGAGWCSCEQSCGGEASFRREVRERRHAVPNAGRAREDSGARMPGKCGSPECRPQGCSVNVGLDCLSRTLIEHSFDPVKRSRVRSEIWEQPNAVRGAAERRVASWLVGPEGVSASECPKR